MSTSPAITSAPGAPQQVAAPRLLDELRAVPPALWLVAAVWSLGAWLLLWPWRFELGGWGGPVMSLLAGLATIFAPLLRLAVVAAPLVTLRSPRWGLILGLAGLVPLVLDHGLGLQLGGAVALAGVAGLSAWRGRRVAAAPLALALLAVTAGWLLAPMVGLVGPRELAWRYPRTLGEAAVGCVLLWTLVGSLAAVTALGVRAARRAERERRALADGRAAVAQEQAVLRTEAAAVDERARLARDLHDIVAHRISLIAVRAETAPYAHPDMDPAAREVLASVAVDARTALDEMREVLGVLHRSQEKGARAPQPGTADLASLVAETRRAGTPVEVSGTLPELPETVGTVVYRVVQEALTNARRHGTGPVTVAYAQSGGAVIITVRNPAPGAAGDPGRGLAGMTERLQLVGGTVTTRSTNGEFVLEATVPRPADA